MERRKAMRFRNNIASHAVPEAKQHKVRLAALHAPHCLRGRPKSSPRAMCENECAWLKRSGCLKTESEIRGDACCRITLNRRPREGGDP
jgi:hypothetical protein